MQKIVENKSIVTTRSKWEYLEQDDQIDTNTLNQLGQDGWELLPLHIENRLIFKRPSIYSVKDNS